MPGRGGQIRLSPSKGLADLPQRLREAPQRLEKARQAATNRTARFLRSAAAKETTAKYAIGRNTLLSYTSLRYADRQHTGAVVVLRSRPIPYSALDVRVAMERQTVNAYRGKASRVLPVVRLRLERAKGYEVLPGVFPLRQRKSGPLAKGERLVKRIGRDRGRLTNPKFFTFPEAFVRGQLLPSLRAQAPGRLAFEFQGALRAIGGIL